MKVPLKKLIPAALAFILALSSFGGCMKKRVDYESLLPEAANPAPDYSASSGEDAEASEARLTIQYNTADPLNPYLLKTKTNSRVSGLLYEGLFALVLSRRADRRHQRRV